MTPTKEWLAQWELVKDKLVCPSDLNAYFEKAEMEGKQLAVMDIGPCSVPSGQLLVRDPLVYLGERNEQPYFITAPAGTYQTEICVVKPDEDGDCARYAAVRLRFTKQPAARFTEALVGHENLVELEDDSFFGFCVDAGLGCICDETLHQAFCDFSDQWEEQHPDGNLYDDYFSELFAKNQKNNPLFQRQGGDWLNWVIPGTEYHLPIFQSGFGDGLYPVYWGYDKDGMLCQLVVQLIDIALAYAEDDEDDEDDEVGEE